MVNLYGDMADMFKRLRFLKLSWDSIHQIQKDVSKVMNHTGFFDEWAESESCDFEESDEEEALYQMGYLSPCVDRCPSDCDCTDASCDCCSDGW